MMSSLPAGDRIGREGWDWPDRTRRACAGPGKRNSGGGHRIHCIAPIPRDFGRRLGAFSHEPAICFCISRPHVRLLRGRNWRASTPPCRAGTAFAGQAESRLTLRRGGTDPEVELPPNGQPGIRGPTATAFSFALAHAIPAGSIKTETYPVETHATLSAPQ